MLPPLPEWASLALVLSVSALLAHQIFRKFETISLPFHAFLLFIPPAIAASGANSAGIEWPLLYRFAFCYTTYIGPLAISVITYRLSAFHSLYRYAGPLWCRMSMLCHAIRMTGGKQMTYFRSLHDAYGDIVRIGPNHLSIRDPSLVGPILGASGIPKGPTYKGAALTEANVPFISIQNVEEHARYEYMMASRVQQLVNLLEQQEGPLFLGRWIKYFAYDFMSDMAFGGGESEQMQEGDRSDIWAIADTGAQIAYFLGQIPWLGIYLGYLPGAGRAASMILEHSRKETTKRLARGSSSRDLFYYLNNEGLPDEAPPPTRHLLNDSILAMAAASETTSGAIVNIFHCLLANPEAYAALQDEVDRFYPQGTDSCNTTHHRDMHYLTAVIHETLRLWPPAATSTPRQVPHDAATVVLGSMVLPPGTYVSVPPCVLHRDGRNFVFPDTFWPELWLVAAGQLPLERARPPQALAPPSSSDGVRFVHNRAAFIPFSHGSVNCPGKGLAMLEMRTVVCTLVQRFRIRLRGQGDLKRDGDEIKGYLTANRLELPVVLEPHSSVRALGQPPAPVAVSRLP